MGNSIYRMSPRKIYNAVKGNSTYYEFAANQITGWRNTQEDRYVCLPDFSEDFSLFAVYDGHGGEEVVVYLERFLHQFISRELELTKDVELALYLSFLNCDSSLRSISDAELAVLEHDLEKEFEVPDKAERRKVLFGSMDVAGTSGENQLTDDLRAAITSACIKELPSVSYLTQAPIHETDSSDDEYQPGDRDIRFFKEDSSGETSTIDTSESCSPESDDDAIMDMAEEEKTEKRVESTKKEGTGCSSGADMTENTVKDGENREEQECTEDFGKQIGLNCGSTATVIVMNERKVYIAHIGDSRSVACVKGQALDLTTDHRPIDKEEYERITKAGGLVSEEGRIQNDIDMSRAFGDFRYKPIDNPFQILSAEPSVSSIEISPDLEFIIVASDGIWNTMDSADVINYIHWRISDPSVELKDICGELFEELLPEIATEDGSGCDNMTAIIIKFCSYEGFMCKNICYQEVYEYKYPYDDGKSDNNTDKSNNATSNKSNSSTSENKNFKESGNLNLVEKKPHNEIFIKSKYENKIYYIDSSDESELGEKKTNNEDDGEMKWRYLFEKCKGTLYHGERIPTDQKQNLCNSNENKCEPVNACAAMQWQMDNRLIEEINPELFPPNDENDGEMEWRYSSENSKGTLYHGERIPTDQNQHLYNSNENKCEPVNACAAMQWQMDNRLIEEINPELFPQQEDEVQYIPMKKIEVIEYLDDDNISDDADLMEVIKVSYINTEAAKVKAVSVGSATEVTLGKTDPVDSTNKELAEQSPNPPGQATEIWGKTGPVDSTNKEPVEQSTNPPGQTTEIWGIADPVDSTNKEPIEQSPNPLGQATEIWGKTDPVDSTNKEPVEQSPNPPVEPVKQNLNVEHIDMKKIEVIDFLNDDLCSNRL